MSAAVLGDAVSEVSVSNKNTMMIKFHEAVAKKKKNSLTVTKHEYNGVTVSPPFK